MKKRLCYLFVFEGYADWEPALAIAGLVKYSDFEVKTFSVDGSPIRSMGTMQIQPDCSLTEVSAEQAHLLILPGGDLWEAGGNMEVATLVEEFRKQGKTIATICGSTLLPAKMGLFNEIRHTSNTLDFLQKNAPIFYKGEYLYQTEPCVVDNNIISANGAAMIEFAFEIFKHFAIIPEDQLVFFRQLYKNAGMFSGEYAAGQ